MPVDESYDQFQCVSLGVPLVNFPRPAQCGSAELVFCWFIAVSAKVGLSDRDHDGCAH